MSCVRGNRNAGCTIVSCSGDPGLIPGQSTWDLWSTKWHWADFLSHFSFRVLVHAVNTPFIYIYICHKCYIILALNRGRLVNPVMNLQVPQNVGNFWTS